MWAPSCRYLEEAFPSPSYPALFPRELHLKAKGREWIQFITVNVRSPLYLIDCLDVTREMIDALCPCYSEAPSWR